MIEIDGEFFADIKEILSAERRRVILERNTAAAEIIVAGIFETIKMCADGDNGAFVSIELAKHQAQVVISQPVLPRFAVGGIVPEKTSDGEIVLRQEEASIILNDG